MVQPAWIGRASAGEHSGPAGVLTELLGVQVVRESVLSGITRGLCGRCGVLNAAGSEWSWCFYSCRGAYPLQLNAIFDVASGALEWGCTWRSPSVGRRCSKHHRRSVRSATTTTDQLAHLTESVAGHDCRAHI